MNIPATVEVDLIFPRNETYAPTRYMPFIFAFQNPSPATLLHVRIDYKVWNSNDTKTVEDMRLNNTVASGNVSLPSIDLNLPENSSYLVQDFSAKFNVEGHFAILWYLYWYSCIEAASNVTLHLWTGGVFFSTSNSHPEKEIDLVASTNDE